MLYFRKLGETLNTNDLLVKRGIYMESGFHSMISIQAYKVFCHGYAIKYSYVAFYAKKLGAEVAGCN